MSVGDGISLATLLILIANYLQGKGNRGKIEDVHDIVNGAADKQTARINQLGDALEQAGVDVPDRPNGPGHAV